MSGTLKCTYLSGVVEKFEMSLKNFKDFSDCFEQGKSFQFADKYQKGIRCELVASFTFIYEGEVYETPKPPTLEKIVEPYAKAVEDYKARRDSSGDAFVVQVQCKCGADYINSLKHYQTKDGCNVCKKEIVFLDKTKGYFFSDDANTKVMLMTNRYKVDR